MRGSRKVAALIALCFSVAHMATPQQQPSVAERYLFDSVNKERRAAGLTDLNWNPQLAQAAKAHADRMAARDEISHQFAGEADLMERLTASSASFSQVAENVGVSYDAQSLHRAWMESPGHRANILDPKLTSLGVAVVFRNDSLWGVQDFSRETINLTFAQQEQQVTKLLVGAGSLQTIAPTLDARLSCSMNTGYAGDRKPFFVMRYTASDLTRLPDQIKQRLQTGKYREAAIGACQGKRTALKGYNIAILLYP